MESKTRTIIIGAIFGGVTGYIIGSIIADYVAPEYYTPEELAEMKQISKDEGYFEETPSAVEVNPKDRRQVGTKHQAKDYTKYYVGSDDEKPDLIELARTRDLSKEKLEEDHIMDDDGNYLEEEDIYEDMDLPIIDYGDLDSMDEELFIDLRDTEDPYVMTENEWKARESEFRRATLMYYSEDDVLTDAKDIPVENALKLVGDYALSNFGAFNTHGDTVYVCNPHLEIEYQVVLIDGSYEETVVQGPRKKEQRTFNVFEDEGWPDGEGTHNPPSAKS